MSTSHTERNARPRPTCNKEDWDLVVSYLHWGGANEHVLSTAEQREVRLLGDGFGKIPYLPSDPNLVWDWSHVRDSSSEAVTEMANKIRSILAAKLPGSPS